MRIISSVAAQIDALMLRPPGAAWIEQRRQLTFVLEKLFLAAVALAITPPLLLQIGTPKPVEACFFAFSCMPLLAATVIMRSGNLLFGHLISVVGLAGATLMLAVSVRGGMTPALLLTFAIALDGALLFESPRKSSIGFIVAALVVGLVVATKPTVTAPINIAAAAFCLSTAAFLSIAIRIHVLFGDMRRANRSLRDRFERLAEATGKLVVLLDAQGTVQQTWGALPGGNLDVVTAPGKLLRHSLRLEDRKRFASLSDAATVTGVVATEAFEFLSQPGTFDITIAADTDSAAEAGPYRDGSLAIIAPALERIAPPAALEAAKADGSELKTEFLANVSHELRTPLNAIIGFSEMLASHTVRPVEQEKQREYATIIYDSGQHLLSVINSILDMSKLRSGTFKLICEPFEVAPLIKQCCDMVRLKAETNCVALRVQTSADIGEFDGDRRAFKQILLNLLSNAVRFTPEGGEVQARFENDRGQLSMVVADTGIGIGRADLEKIGQPFFQARSTLCRPFEGTGLGLSVVRGLVDLQGGSFLVESELGKGTTVTVKLPHARSSVSELGDDIDGDALAAPYRSDWQAQEWPAPLDAANIRIKQIA